jgi:aminoglycoside phosphotransferase (APT) family kinase protein
MSNQYLGKVDYSDPLYEILYSRVCPDIKDPLFHVKRMSLHSVYKYTEEKSKIAIIGKFFKLNDTQQDRILRIKGEYDNLEKIRGYGFDSSPHYVVRPITRDEKIGLALIEEYVYGKDLDYYLKRAIYEGKNVSLMGKLSRLASFLYVLHEKSETAYTIELDFVSTYFQKVVNKLHSQGVLSDCDRKEYLKLKDKWLDRTLLQNTKSVIVHGDATPTNFIFTQMGDVVAIDLERMKNTDLAFDVSMICGELKHAFLWRTGDPYASEPFIRHFLKSYSRHSYNRKKAFKEITLRNPFYMALTELRIARNDYLEWNYRKRLAYEAKECLRWGLKLK